MLPWLALIPVALLELGAALSVFVARTVSASPTQRNARQRTLVSQELASEPPSSNQAAVASPENDQSDAPSSAGVSTQQAVRGRPALGQILNNLKQWGGTLEGSTRDPAEELNLSKSTVHCVIQDLATSGLIAVEATTRGTKLALV